VKSASYAHFPFFSRQNTTGRDRKIKGFDSDEEDGLSACLRLATKTIEGRF
jgi:hypothetical protein